MWIHLHSGSWGLALILFGLSLVLLRLGKMRAHKVASMLLRLNYLVVIMTGFTLIMSYQMMGSTLLKGGLAFALIALMEMIHVRTAKGQKPVLIWILFALDLAAVLYMGLVVIE